MNVKNFKLNTENVCLFGILTAAEVVLTRFAAINTPITKIGLGFVPVMLAGIMTGPVGGGIVGALGDLIGANLFPTGAYFPGFTLTALLAGVIWGLLLEKGGKGLIKPAAAVLTVQICFELGINSLWISMLSGSSYGALFTVRSVQCLIMIPVQFAGALILQKIGGRIK